ncbi:hypothetical protein H0H81_010007 [Sphagnurus paluster]|uniref:DUF6535 domain-containing protein n=1 Tax=Sphagnurus paluster TaxID=117069 RepID=A0A9P7K4E9_9AGAR|nr:hypothetical protein H0H81_010007 [Sphagnurus paluster]
MDSVITSFIIESYTQLQQDPGDLTNALLTQVLTLQLALASNQTATIPTTIAPPPSFKPPSYVVAVNILWFLSLGFSLAAALCVTFLQQWVRDYMQRIQRNSKPVRRARIRTFLSEGMKTWKMHVLVKYIPIFLHASLFLFLGGLCLFLYPVNHAVAATAVAVLVVCVGFYCLGTIAPIIDLSAPYETPISSIIWQCLKFLSPRKSYSHHLPTPKTLADARVERAAYPFSEEERIERDKRSLQWLCERLSGDGDLEPLVESIPDFLESAHSRRAWDLAFMSPSIPISTIEAPIKALLSTCVRRGHLDSTVRRRRATVCVDALYSIQLQSADIDLRMRSDCAFSSKSILASLDFPPIARNYLPIEIATIDWGDRHMVATKALCTEALYGCHRLFRFAKEIDHAMLPDFARLSAAADRALTIAVDMQRQLTELVAHNTTAQIPAEQLQVILQACSVELKYGTRSLLSWRAAIPDAFNRPGGCPPCFGWYQSLPWTGHVHSCYGLPRDSGQFHLLPHHILAFMRRMNVYPQQLGETPGSTAFFTTSFPTDADADEYLRTNGGDHHEGVTREVHSVLESLDPSQEAPAEGESPIPFLLTNLLPLRSPFTIFSWMLDSIASRSRVVFLAHFIYSLKNRPVSKVEPSVILETLNAIFPANVELVGEGPQVLFVAVLQEILLMERDATPENPSPFSARAIKQLVGYLKAHVTENLALEAAERIIGTAHKERFKLQLDRTSEIQEVARIRAEGIHDHAMGERLPNYCIEDDKKSMMSIGSLNSVGFLK